MMPSQEVKLLINALSISLVQAVQKDNHSLNMIPGDHTRKWIKGIALEFKDAETRCAELQTELVYFANMIDGLTKQGKMVLSPHDAEVLKRVTGLIAEAIR